MWGLLAQFPHCNLESTAIFHSINIWKGLALVLSDSVCAQQTCPESQGRIIPSSLSYRTNAKEIFSRWLAQVPFLDRGKGLDFFFFTCHMQEADKGNTRSGPGLGQAHFANYQLGAVDNWKLFALQCHFIPRWRGCRKGTARQKAFLNSMCQLQAVTAVTGPVPLVGGKEFWSHLLVIRGDTTVSSDLVISSLNSHVLSGSEGMRVDTDVSSWLWSCLRQGSWHLLSELPKGVTQNTLLLDSGRKHVLNASVGHEKAKTRTNIWVHMSSSITLNRVEHLSF